MCAHSSPMLQNRSWQTMTWRSFCFGLAGAEGQGWRVGLSGGVRPFPLQNCRKKSPSFSSGASVVSSYLIFGTYFGLSVD